MMIITILMKLKTNLNKLLSFYYNKMSKSGKEEFRFVKIGDIFLDEINNVKYEFNSSYKTGPLKIYSNSSVVKITSDELEPVICFEEFINNRRNEKFDIEFKNGFIDLSNFHLKNILVSQGKIKNFSNSSKIFLNLFNAHFIQNFEQCLENEVEINVVCFDPIFAKMLPYKHMSSKNRELRIPTKMRHVGWNNEDETILAFLTKKARSYQKEFNYYFQTDMMTDGSVGRCVEGSKILYTSGEITDEMIASYDDVIDYNIRLFFESYGVIYDENFDKNPQNYDFEDLLLFGE